MTVSDTIYDTINDNWGNGGYGGATPKIETTETQRSNNVISTDVITVYHAGQKRDDNQVNDKYANKYYTLYVHVSSRTSAAQNKLLYDEVEYLLRNTTMTGIALDKLGFAHDEVAWTRGEHKVVWTVKVVALMSDGAITSATTAGTDLTVGGDVISSSVYSLEEALMLGSANAAWVVCPLEDAYYTALWRLSTDGGVTNIGAGDPWVFYSVPLPTNKGSLKLYISGTMVGLSKANATNKVTSRYVRGYRGATAVDTNLNDLTSVDDHEDTFTGVDCSSYKAMKVELRTDVANATTLEIDYVLVQCYYDT